MSWWRLAAAIIHGGAELRSRLDDRGWSLTGDCTVLDEHGEPVPASEVWAALGEPPREVVDLGDVIDVTDL